MHSSKRPPLAFVGGALLLAVSLAACGGGGSSSSANPAPPPAPSPAGALDGAIAKGIVIAGDIEIREVLTDGTLSDVLGTAATGANGDYAADVSADYQGGPLKVTVTANANTTMKCDAPSGCAGAPFGDEVPLAEGFSLSAFIPVLEGDSVSVHVTPVTDLAARRAEADPDGLDADAVTQANDVVRQTFNLPGDITEIRPVDLTDPDAVAAADTASQQVAVLSAGILESVQQTDAVVNGGVSFEDALDTFADDYAADGGLVLNDTAASEDTVVSLDDILDGSSSVVDQVTAEADAAGVDAGLEDVAASIALADAEIPDTPSDDPDTSIEPVDTALAARLDQGKALISDLRDMTASARLDELELAADTFGDSIELAFSEQVDMVTGVVTNDLGLVAEALGMAVDAMSQAAEAAQDDATLTSFVIPAGELGPNAPEVTVAINGTMLSVDQDIDGVTLLLNGNFDFVSSEGQDDVSEFASAEGAISLEGSATNDEFSFTINAGSQASAQYDSVDTITDDGDMMTLSVPTVALDLNVTIVALASAAAPQFDGVVDFELTGLEYTEDDSTTQAPDGTTTNTSVEMISLASAELSLSGTFADGAGNSVEATFSISLDNDRGYILQIEELFSWDPVLGNTYTESTIEETEDNFVAASLTVGLTASLPGIDDTVQVMLTAERTGVEDGMGELNVQFDGKSITVSGNSIDEVVTIVNQDGVTATLFEDSTTGMLTGSIVVDDEEVATIEENEDGVVVIRYSDGTFETFA